MNIFIIVAVLSSFFCIEAFAFQVRVVGVTDGDTIAVLGTEKIQHKIRLAEIDAPESGQPFGSSSRKVLSDLVFGEEVDVEPIDTDRYGRTIARIRADGRDVSREMIAQGAAWVYRQYLTDQTLLAVEAEARAARRGLVGAAGRPDRTTLGMAAWRVNSRQAGRERALSDRSWRQPGSTSGE